MKRFARCICAILAILLTLAVPVSATETVEPRASYYFAASSYYLYKTSSSTFQAWFEVTGTGSMDEIGVSKIVIQKSADNVNWTTTATYTRNSFAHFIAKGTFAHCGCIDYTGTPGYYYRAIITFYAKNSSGSGEMIKYTSSMKL